MEEQDKRPAVVKVTTKNKFGIIAVHGDGVENGSLTEENVDEHIEQMTPILDALQPELEKRRAKISVEEDDLREQKRVEQERLSENFFLD